MGKELKELSRICNLFIDKLLSVEVYNQDYNLLSPSQSEQLVKALEYARVLSGILNSILWCSGIEDGGDDKR